MSLLHHDFGACSCPACSGQPGGGDTQSSFADHTPQMAPTYSDSQVIGQIRSGASWTASTITFGFLDSGPVWDVGWEANGFSAFTAAQEAAARAIMTLWDGLIARSIAERTTGPEYADVNFGNTTSAIDYAHAYYPGTYSWAGEVWLNAQTYGGLYSPDPGDYYWMTIIHEVGHALGLSHPGSYNGGSPTYANDAEYAQDTHQWTVMSYFSASNTGADWNGGTGWQYAQTPMVHDILTVQSIYGADPTTRAGNTTYGFNSNAGNWVFDFSLNRAPVLSIYDAGGIDTLDLSGFAQRAVIDLGPGTYSSAGGTTSSMTYNIGIAGNTWIENAVGGSGNDVIHGNVRENVLSGGGGNDHLHGLAGNDTLAGGAGIDWAYFEYAFSTYTFQIVDAAIQVIGDFVDTVLGDVEWFSFQDLSRSWGDLYAFAGTPVVVESNGGFDLVSSGGQYRIQNGAGVDVGYTYQASPVGPGTFANLTATQAEEKPGGGFQVLWEHANKNTYVVSTLDQSGAWQSSTLIDRADLATHEGAFEADLDGDSLIGPPVPITIETNGEYDLVEAGGQYRIRDGAGVDVGYTYQGAPVGSDTFANLTATQAEEKAGGGFQVLWAHANGSMYVVSALDQSGAWQASTVIDQGELVNHESAFEADLDGDGVIGRPTRTIETNGDFDLIEVGGQYRIQDGAGVDVGYTYQGNPVGPGTFANLTAIEAEEKAGGGFQVLWAHANGSMYVVSALDQSGAWQASTVIDHSDLVNHEDAFAFDLDGDGVIGQPARTIETNGDHDLVEAGGQYRIGDGFGVDVGYTYQGAPVGPGTFAKMTALQAEEKAGGGFQVLWAHDNGSTYVVSALDQSGAWQASTVIDQGELVNHESAFEADLDGDGVIGRPTRTIETNGDFDLIEVGGQYRIQDGAGVDVGYTYQGNPVGPGTFAKTTALQAEEKADGGFEVLWQHGSGDYYVVSALDGAGAWQSSTVIDQGDLVNYESAFEADLNGDGALGQLVAEQDADWNAYGDTVQDDWNFALL